MWKMLLSCDGICIFIWNAPKSKTFNFSSFSVLKLITFSDSNRKNGAFQNFSTWSVLKLKRNRKWNSLILGHFKIQCPCHLMSKSSFTCFLGHFILPPLNWKIIGLDLKTYSSSKKVHPNRNTLGVVCFDYSWMIEF